MSSGFGDFVFIVGAVIAAIVGSWFMAVAALLIGWALNMTEQP